MGLLAGCAGTPPDASPLSVSGLPAAVAHPVPDAALAQSLLQPADATVLPSGLVYKILKPGDSSEYPTLHDGITLNYSLWRPDGALLESTCSNDGACAPASFNPVSMLIKGWQLAIPLMTPGEKMRLWVPAALAYGDKPRSDAHAPTGPLIFDLELVSVNHS